MWLKDLDSELNKSFKAEDTNVYIQSNYLHSQTAFLTHCEEAAYKMKRQSNKAAKIRDDH